MASNGQAKKDFAPILKASAAVKEAEEFLAQARAKLNAEGEAWLRKHGQKVQRNIGTGETAKKVETYSAKPIIGDDGRLYEVLMRHTTNGVNVVVRTRELG